jgi:hypothetical protein
MEYKAYTIHLLNLTLTVFFIVTLVAIATTKMSNEETNGGVFGSFDSTGAAILLVGFPYLCLQYVKHLNGK